MLKEHLSTLTFLTDGRFLGETLHTAIVEEIGTKFLIVLEHRIEEIHEVCSLWCVVKTKAILVRGICACSCDKVNIYISIIAEIVAPIDTDSDIERTCSKVLFIGRITKVVEENFPQLIAIGVTIYLLVLDNLSYLRFLFREELVYLRARICFDFTNYSLVNQIGKNS